MAAGNKPDNKNKLTEKKNKAISNGRIIRLNLHRG